ncbi:MAG: hypothetical protein FJ279_33755, partial [Planctomycetes bacterium]|nr:hypothetical protein [Planctomycetota bacterium]
MTAGMVWAMMGLMAGGGWAQMPTTEERARESSLNLEYCRWRASFLRLEKREEAPLVACYRKDFTLTAKPRQAAITVNAPYFGRYWFAVNGQALLEPRADRLQVGGLRNLDITAWLRQGQNTITFKGEVKGIWLNSWLSIEGIAFGEDGSTTRLLTDGWKGGWSAPEGWDLPAPQASRQAGKPDKETVGLTPLRNYEPLKGDPGGDALTLPYYGPIQVSPLGIREPIYDEGKPIQLDVTLLNVQSQVQPTLAVEIVDEMSRKPVGQQTVTLSPKGKLDLAGSVRHAGLPAGAYRFRFVLTAEGKEVDRRDYEVACVGEIKQRRVDGTHFEDGLELKEIWRVDCTAEPKPGEFVASIGGRQWKEGEWQEVETKVEQGAAGKYRALADARPFAFLAYRYKVQRLFTPHLVVVEWPDDAERSFIAHVTEGTTMFPNPRHRYVTGGYQRAEASVVSQHDLQPRRSNRMQKLHLLYWPNEAEAAIHLTNVYGAKA